MKDHACNSFYVPFHICIWSWANELLEINDVVTAASAIPDHHRPTAWHLLGPIRNFIIYFFFAYLPHSLCVCPAWFPLSVFFLFFIMPFFCSLASFHEQLMDCLSQDIAHTSAKDKTCMKSTEREVQWCDPTSVREFILKEKKEKKGTARGKSSQSRWFHTTQDALGEEASPGHLPWGKHSKPTDGHGQSRRNCFWAAASPRLTSQFGSIRPKQQAKSEWNQI